MGVPLHTADVTPAPCPGFWRHPGKDDLDQMDKIFHIMGPPTEAAWPGVTALNLKKWVACCRKTWVGAGPYGWCCC